MAGLLYPLRASECSTATTVNILLGVIHVLLPCFRQGGGQVIEPVPSMVELWQAEEAELVLHAQSDTDQSPGENPQEQNFARPSGRALHLQPSVLDFGTQSVGLPKIQTFCAFNPCRDRDVEVNSVFTSGRHFHVSPIQSRVIPARGKASFTVVFLPDEEGNFEGSLYLNTSLHGILPYQVFGVGILAIGSEEFKQNTDVIFPHIANIHLSQSQAEAINSSVWQVRLKCSAPFKKHLNQRSCIQTGHPLLLQIFFAVRLDGGQHDLETLRNYVLENILMIFVTSSHNDDLAFGVYVLNSGSGLVHMQDVHHFLGDTLNVHFEPVMLLSASKNFTRAATISCSAVSLDSDFNLLEDTRSNSLEADAVLYPCILQNIKEGHLEFDSSNISFYMQPLEDPVGLWSIWLENNRRFHISLADVFVAEENEGSLKILNFTRLLALPPGCWNVFTLKIQAKDTSVNFLTNILIATSLGFLFKIPVHVQSAFPKPGSLQYRVQVQCGIHPLIRALDSGGAFRWQKSLSLSVSAWSIDYELGTELYEKYQKIRDGQNAGKKMFEGLSISQGKRDRERPFTFYLPQLITKPGAMLNFTATALSNSSVMYITLTNPSPFPVILQLLPLSHYPNPQAALSMLSKWYGINEQAFDVTTAEFKLQKECHNMHEVLDESSVEILELQLLPWENRRVGVIFTPLDYRKVTSLIVVRNNLTILDMITVEGVGAREMLRMGGRLPGIGGSLRFKVPESTLMDCRQQPKESKQILSITKIFKVENIGSLPITIQSMKINGYKCQGFGFEVLDCHPFSISQNSSWEISIVFIPDFTSSWVIRELTLVSSSKLEFRFTLNVTLPHHLLPLCADGLPGPSWEDSFWKLTVLFVSFSLLGVILIAIQQAQYILTEFLKLRHRNSTSSVSQQISCTVDTITSESFRGSCKNFTDSISPPDKGKGKGYLAVTASQNRSQNASKRGPATYSHSQKKHKCSVYYSIKQKSSHSAANSGATACDVRDQQTSDMPSASSKELDSNETLNINLIDTTGTEIKRHLSSPDSNLGKEETTLQDPLLQQRNSNKCPLKEQPVICMFPMETHLKTSECLSETKLQQDFCDIPMSRKASVTHLSRSLSHLQMETQTVSKKTEGNRQHPPATSNRNSFEALKKQPVGEVSTEKIPHNTTREDKNYGRANVACVKHEEPFRKKSPVEKRDGIFPNLNWNKNRPCSRKNKKKSIFTARGAEQDDLKYRCQEVERTELRGPNRVKHWNSVPNDIYKREPKNGRYPPHVETECYQILKKKPTDKIASDSSSDCSSSRGSVRASRGSWGSWSSASSSDGDKKNVLPARHYFPSRENMSQSVFSVEAPIALNLSHSICNTSSDINTTSHFPENVPPRFTSATDSEKNKGPYSQEDLWSTQPLCLTNDVNYNVESTVPCLMRDPPPVQNSFMNWNSTCDGQFSSMYGHGPLEINDLGSYNEENLNYHNGFSCPEVQNPTFVEQQCQPAWSMSAPVPPATPQEPSMPSSWEPATYPYLSSTRSLSPMSGLFGSIWAPQNDFFDGYCPVSGSPPHSEHVGNHSVMCKQEYSQRFNPFHAYVNLDIWTTTANRNATFPISRDSGYCGNM